MSVASTARSFGAIVVLSVLAACQTTPSEPRLALTADEVRDTFVDRDWGFKPTTTHFDFQADGTYSYQDSKINVFGKYDIAEDGELCVENDAQSQAPGRRTCFTFYKQGEKYVYYHDRSGKYYPAYLR